MKRMALVALGFALALSFAFAPQASAAQANGGFAINVIAEWLDSTGAINTVNFAKAFDFVTAAQAAAGQTSPGVPGPMTIADVSGDFAAVLSVGMAGTVRDFTFSGPAINGNYPAPPVADFEVIPGLLSVRIDSIAEVTTFCNNALLNPDCTNNSLTNSARVVGHATFFLAGFDPTPGVFQINVGSIASTFSGDVQNGTTPRVPEPMTILLLGTGLVGMGAVARFRRA